MFDFSDDECFRLPYFEVVLDEIFHLPFPEYWHESHLYPQNIAGLSNYLGVSQDEISKKLGSALKFYHQVLDASIQYDSNRLDHYSIFIDTTPKLSALEVCISNNQSSTTIPLFELKKYITGFLPPKTILFLSSPDGRRAFSLAMYYYSLGFIAILKTHP